MLAVSSSLYVDKLNISPKRTGIITTKLLVSYEARDECIDSSLVEIGLGKNMRHLG